MKCFIASAFGREDVDAVYDCCVSPTLKSLGIQPLRVDRVEHNEDIDKKIVELLDQADFVIADLTYARPSVYYEAGYAAGRGKPVIYIARGDHLRARDDDPEGNRRVHFDLQMKNIISWTKPNAAFTERLVNRVKFVLKPLLQQRRIDEKLGRERSQFAGLSQDAKIELVSRKAGNLLKARAFRLPKTVPSRGPRYGAFNGIRYSDQKHQEVRVVCLPSATTRFFSGLEVAGFLGVSRKLPVSLHWMVVTLRPVPQSRVAQGMPSFRVLDDGTFHTTYDSAYGLAVDKYVHVLGGIKSEQEFTEGFRSILERYGLDRKQLPG